MPDLPAPTPSELRILHCLWNEGPMTVREVHDRLGVVADLSYTTILKQLQIMYEKGLVKRDTGQRAHVFFPTSTREQTQKRMLDDFTSRVYGGSTSRLVLQALGMSRPANPQELEEINRLIQGLRKSQKERETD